MNFITYIPPVKPDGQAQGCILRRSMVINLLGSDSPVGCRQLFHFSWSENLAYSSPSNHRNFAASRSMPYMAYIAHVVTGVWCGEVNICDAHVCTVCV